MKALDLVRPVDRSADDLNGRSYLLLGRQPVPGQNRFLQCGAIRLCAGSIVEGRGLPRIDIDFVMVAHLDSQGPTDTPRCIAKDAWSARR